MGISSCCQKCLQYLRSVKVTLLLVTRVIVVRLGLEAAQLLDGVISVHGQPSLAAVVLAVAVDELLL